MNTEVDPSSLGAGAAAYGGVLVRAGGRELERACRASAPDALAVALYASPPYDLQVPAIAVARLSINLTDSPVSGALDGDRPCTHATRPHSLFFTPAGAAARWRKARPSRHVNVYFDDDGYGLGDVPRLNVLLPAARPLIAQLAAELASADPFAAEAADSLARLILVQLARQRPAGDTMSPAMLSRVAEFVHAHLDQRLLVGDLARAAGLPAARFAAGFARATGRTPHQYVLDRRVEHAVQLLRGTRQPLAGVAAACGFSNQQHMTRLLGRRLGATPARLRAAGAQ